MTAPPPPFPAKTPPGYRRMAEEPRYDAGRHLALEPPGAVWTLDDFGYGSSEVVHCASPVAISGPFRILSAEGLAALRQVTLTLRSERTLLDGNRVPSHLAGGVYRSEFLRDFCNCPVIAEFLSGIAGTPLAPHSMPSQQLYVNYTPDDIAKAVDAWHYDGIGFDYVLMLSEPAALAGGRFEFFRGTKAEAASLLGVPLAELRDGGTGAVPRDRVESVSFPAAGYGIFQQGSMVVHRAARLERPAERITMVPGYVARDLTGADPTDWVRMPFYGEPGIRTELARHAAWLGQSKLARLIEELPFTDDPALLAAALRGAVADIERAVARFEAVGGSEVSGHAAAGWNARP